MACRSRTTAARFTTTRICSRARCDSCGRRQRPARSFPAGRRKDGLDRVRIEPAGLRLTPQLVGSLVGIHYQLHQSDYCYFTRGLARVGRTSFGTPVLVLRFEGHTSEALHRIEQGTFGVCRDCGEPIAEARLRAIPWTRVCITCKEKQSS